MYIQTRIKRKRNILEVNSLSRFSEVLTSLMEKNSINDAALADRVDVNRSTVARWRSGTRSPKLDKLPEIASVFHVNPKLFIDEAAIQESNLKVEINNTFDQLNNVGQKRVVSFAQLQLEQQKQPEKIKELYPKTLAAHADDPDRVYTDDELNELEQYLDGVIDKHNQKHPKK